MYVGDYNYGEALETSLMLDSALAERARPILFGNLLTSSDPEERYLIARALPLVLAPEDASGVLTDERFLSDHDALARVIWALGELYSPTVAPHLLRFCFHQDSQVVKVAITAIAKSDQGMRAALAEFGKHNDTLTRRRYVQGFESLYGMDYHQKPSLTLVQVRDADTVRRETDEHTSEALGLQVVLAHEEHAVAAASDWYGLWVAWVYPVVAGVAANALCALVQKGLARAQRLKRSGEQPRINGAFAKAVCEARMTELRIPFLLRKSVTRFYLTPDDAREDRHAFLIEYETPQGRLRFVMSNAGDIVSPDPLKPCRGDDDGAPRN